ncbi:MAG: hypothetical protein CL521_00700 [Actinobacteria bacterium]|nr:hypothetical protein [Actinomycetota bacterium]|tara:strand:+ start:501 stop:857 length:357 start_codon:yes stop_codon:yes gene_type:complete
MSQYQLIIDQGTVTQENGFFFRATPFVISQNERQIHCSFEGNDEYEVTYVIKENGVRLLELEFSDYSPSESEFESVIKGQDLSFVLLALHHLGIASNIYDLVPSSASYQVHQDPLFDT